MKSIPLGVDVARHARVSNIKSRAAGLISLAMAAFFFVPVNVAIADEFDVNFQALVFNEDLQQRTLIRGANVTVFNAGQSSGNAGTQLNDKVLYSRVIQVGSTWIDALVEVVGLTGNPTIDRFDGGSAVDNSKNMFQTDIRSGNTSTVSLKFTFFESGTFDASSSSGNLVTLKNVLVNSYDIDGSQNNSRQFSQFTGFQKYRLSNSPAISVRTSADNVLPAIPAGSTRFLSNVTTNTTASNASRVQVTYDYLSTFIATHGVDNAGSGGISYFALEFGPGDAFGSSTETLNTSSNRPPISSNTEIFFSPNDVSGDVPRVLSVADFGNYSDPDNNPFVRIRVESLPANGVLKKFNGTTWDNVLANDLVTVAEIGAGNLGYFYSGPGSDVFNFSVNDNLAFSVAPYTLTLTPVSETQTITFPQPSAHPFSATVASSATASSSLPVLLQSNTPGICFVSGLDIIMRSTAGVCSVTASQGGNSTFAAASPITRTFNVSATVTTYTLNFVGNGNDGGSTPGNLTSSGGSVSIPGNTGTLTKDGFTFGGWTIGDTVYGSGDPYTLNSNVTATAVWNAVAVSYTLNFVGNGNDGGSTPGNLTSSGGSVSIPGNTGTLTKDGFTFGGWTIGGPVYNSGDPYTLNSNVTATAVWNAVVVFENPAGSGPMFQLTFSAPSSASGVAPIPLGGLEVVIPGNTGGLKRPGFTFAGWIVDGIEYGPGTRVRLIANKVAFAYWIPNTLRLLDPETEAEVFESFTEVDTITLPDASVMNRDGFELSGWQIGVEVFEPGSEVKIVGSMEAFAIWKIVPTAAAMEPSELADTGYDVTQWFAFASLLLAAGSALLVYARRRA